MVYRSVVRIERKRGALRHAHLPATPVPVMFGVHGDIAESYGIEVETPHATTLDYIVAATGG